MGVIWRSHFVGYKAQSFCVCYKGFILCCYRGVSFKAVSYSMFYKVESLFMGVILCFIRLTQFVFVLRESFCMCYKVESFCMLL